MAEVTVVLINPLGLHARAAAKIVNVVNRTQAEITINRPSTNKSAHASSILGLLELGAKYGSTLVIQSDQDDDDGALCEVVDLINNGFGEI